MERYQERGGMPIIVKRQVVLTGDNLTDAQPGFDENHEAAVHLTLDARVPASSATSPAKTLASAWPSPCSKRARARW